MTRDQQAALAALLLAAVLAMLAHAAWLRWRAVLGLDRRPVPAKPAKSSWTNRRA